MVNILNIAKIKPFLTLDIILSKVKPLDIYKMYIKDDFIINKPFSSPFREDNIPSFSIFVSSDGNLLYNDFVKGGGNCVNFVKELFQESWYEALSRIAIDFNFDKDYVIKKVNTKNTSEKQLNKIKDKLVKIKDKTLDLKVKIRKFEDYDIQYWKKQGINRSTLKKYRVYPISHIFLITESKETILTADKHAYVFIERKDGKNTIKIYQPFSQYKWMNNHDFSVWQGWEQLPSDDHILIITKSLKDVMSISQNTKYSAVSLQQENANAKENVIQELKERFDWIFVLYDNDFDKEINWGEKFGKEFSKQHNLIFLMIPDKYKSTDFTDLVNKYGKAVAISALNELVEEHFNKN